ncbi:MAG: VanW family protein [Candidatus Magasanikbacteria bacterium]
MEFGEKKISVSLNKVSISIGIVVGVPIILFLGFFAYASAYGEKVYPGVQLGDIPLGGMGKSELKSLLEQMTDKVISDGIQFEVLLGDKKESFVIHPIITGEGEAIELFHFDMDSEIENILHAGKSGGIFGQTWGFAQSRFGKKHILSLAHLNIEKDKLKESIEEQAKQYETLPVDATIVIANTDPLQYSFVSSTPGYVFSYDEILGKVEDDWKKLKVPNLQLQTQKQEPMIHDEELLAIVARVPVVFETGPMDLTYVDSQTKLQTTWKISLSQIANWIEMQDIPDNGFGFGLKADPVKEYLQSVVGTKVNVAPRDAKFSFDEENLRVKEFQTSRPGIELDVEQTYADLNGAILQRTLHDDGFTKSVQITVKQAEPNVKTGEVNDLGITEVLGVGTSNFSGSPRNRILNIKNGVKLLDGILIKPGEEFSAIQYTRPYTTDNGYVPELVIKGDEVKPEIGGGLCQIGTTLFRMAMNGGMEITQRRNHSLVVSYYNDPVNKLPGTDATIYEPAPDFRFKNDTEHYVLIDTEVNTNSMELIFTLWGTSDGRQASFTHPIVHRWLSPGEKIVKETTTLEPGKQTCQHSYIGADTSFTYTRIMPNGEKQETLYESHYRPLPEICLVGVAQKTEEAGAEILPLTEPVPVE